MVTISENLKDIIDELKKYPSVSMDNFISKITPHLNTFPSILLPCMRYWAKNPNFDSKGHPYILVPKLEDNKLTSVEIIRQTYNKSNPSNDNLSIPVLYNGNYGGYGFNTEIYNLLSSAGIHDLLDIKREIDQLPNFMDNNDFGKDLILYGNWDSFDIKLKENFYGGKVAYYSNKLSNLMPRHHLFLIGIVCSLENAFIKISTHLKIELIDPSCVESYRIDEYDGSESIIPNEDVANLADK